MDITILLIWDERNKPFLKCIRNIIQARKCAFAIEAAQFPVVTAIGGHLGAFYQWYWRFDAILTEKIQRFALPKFLTYHSRCITHILSTTAKSFFWIFSSWSHSDSSSTTKLFLSSQFHGKCFIANKPLHGIATDMSTMSHYAWFAEIDDNLIQKAIQH